MDKTTLWEQYEKLFGESVSTTDLFNFFDSDQLEEFLEFLKEEHEY